MPLSHARREFLHHEIEGRFFCVHQTRELRRRTIKGGSTTYVRQCVRCGQVSSPVKTDLALREAGAKPIPAYDEQAESNWEAARSEAYKQAHKELEGSVSDEYAAYLASDAWHEVREKVLRRARGLCEGCLEHTATQVHHLSYKNVGHEFMWELVAICDGCHERIHADQDDKVD